MSKVRNLASTIKHLKGESFKRAAVMIRDYGWGEFFHKLGTRIKYGPGTAVVNNNMYGGELAGESFVKIPRSIKDTRRKSGYLLRSPRPFPILGELNY